MYHLYVHKNTKAHSSMQSSISHIVTAKVYYNVYYGNIRALFVYRMITFLALKQEEDDRLLQIIWTEHRKENKASAMCSTSQAAIPGMRIDIFVVAVFHKHVPIFVYEMEESMNESFDTDRKVTLIKTPIYYT